jgi:hypothetical protein
VHSIHCRSLATAVSLALTGCVSIAEKDRVRAQEIAQTSASVDLHAHPGFFSTSPLPMEGQIERMRGGRLKVVLFAAVVPGLGRRPRVAEHRRCPAQPRPLRPGRRQGHRRQLPARLRRGRRGLAYWPIRQKPATVDQAPALRSHSRRWASVGVGAGGGAWAKVAQPAAIAQTTAAISVIRSLPIIVAGCRDGTRHPILAKPARGGDPRAGARC